MAISPISFTGLPKLKPLNEIRTRFRAPDGIPPGSVPPAGPGGGPIQRPAPEPLPELPKPDNDNKKP